LAHLIVPSLFGDLAYAIAFPSFLIAQAWSNELYTSARRKTFCYRTNNSISINFSIFNKSIGIGLAAEHRKELRKHLPYHDIFLYHEGKQSTFLFV
jgi:hypothetical protein